MPVNIGQQIEDIRIIPTLLSTGKYTIGVLTKLQCGIVEWDASPVGTTISENDPSIIDFPDVPKIFDCVQKSFYGQSALDQIAIDNHIIQVLGEDNKGILETNLAIAISCSIARAAAAYKRLPLFLHFADIYNTTPRIPGIMCNMIGGGGHHRNKMKITELMIMMSSFIEADIKHTLKIWNCLYDLFYKQYSVAVGLEGCLVVDNLRDEEAIEILIKIANEAVQTNNIRIGLDLAGIIDGELLNSLIVKYNEIIYLEDPYQFNQLVKFQKLLKRYSSKYIAGDDLLTGQLQDIEILLKENTINAGVIKLNRIGTITRFFKAIQIMRNYRALVVCSQRSQETARDTLSHIAIASGADYLKNGSPVRERIANYSNLIALNQVIK